MRYREALFSRRCELHRQKIRELGNEVRAAQAENEKIRKLRGKRDAKAIALY